MAFCERIEQLEDHSAGAQTKQKEAKGNGKRKRGNNNSNSKERAGKRTGSCMLHDDNCGHDTSQCKVLQAQAKKMKANYDAQSPDKKREFKRKQELNATISAAVEEALASRKKRKRSAADTAKDVELNAFEQLSLSDDDSANSSVSSTVST